MSQAVVTTSNMELTPMRVTFDGVDLGGTLGNISFTAKYMKANIMADQSGQTVRDRRVSGIEVTLTTELTEIQNKDIWKVVFPHATKIGTGTGSLAAIKFDQNVGDGDLANAKQLVLHPLSKPDADLSTDYTFFKAVASAESSITFGPTEQARLKIVWNILPDESQVLNKFFRYGSPAIVQTPAAAAAAVPGGSNVGNGTIGSVSVSNTYTKTETITLSCVTAIANGGVFFVEGSVSGPLGLATVGTPFVSNEIVLTVSDGATDFAAGDSFTIATTAAV